MSNDRSDRGRGRGRGGPSDDRGGREGGRGRGRGGPSGDRGGREGGRGRGRGGLSGDRGGMRSDRGMRGGRGEQKVVQSAVCIIPSSDLWDGIQEIRREHDKAFERWMPHINLLYPFIPVYEFENYVGATINALSSIQPFDIEFNRYGYFTHRSSSTLFLDFDDFPLNSVMNVQRVLEEMFPHCNDLSERGAFSPHLTVGQFDTHRIDSVKAEYERKLIPFTYHVNEVYFISREGNDPFSIKQVVPLGMQGYQNPIIPFPVRSKPKKKQVFLSQDEIIAKWSSIDAEKTKVIQMAPEQTKLISLASKKIIKWLKKNDNLPGTQTKFISTTKKFCSVKIPLLTSKYVIAYMIKNNYIAVFGDETYMIMENKSNDNFMSLLKEEEYSYLEEAQKTLLSNILEWIYSLNQHPTRLRKLQNSLDQLITTRCEANGLSVLDHLAQKNIVQYLKDDKIAYPIKSYQQAY